MQRYLIAGFVWGLFAFATTGKWFAPLVIIAIVAVIHFLIELTENAQATKAGKPRPNPYPTFGAIYAVCGASLVALATWCGK